jgi:hypothetical protein
LFPSIAHQNPFVFMAMEDRQVSRKVIGESPERLRQSAKQSTTVCGQAGRGATVAGRHLLAVQQSSKSGFSTCQVLWKIVGRSASHMAVCRASSFICATQELEPNGKMFPVHRPFIHHGVPVAGEHFGQHIYPSKWQQQIP